MLKRKTRHSASWAGFFRRVGCRVHSAFGSYLIDGAGATDSKLARVVGIKPTLTELEAAVLSLHHTRKSGTDVANRTPSDRFTAGPLIAIEHRQHTALAGTSMFTGSG